MALYRCTGAPAESDVNITLTVEGAKEDNIAIYDSSNNIVGNVIFGSGETFKEIELTIPQAGGNYRFESSVAKATDGSGGNYTKNVALTNSLGNISLSVPLLTEDSPNVSSTAEGTGNKGWYAFNGNNADNGWLPFVWDAICSYKFVSPINVTRATVLMYDPQSRPIKNNVQIVGRNEGETTWTTLSDVFTMSGTNVTDEIICTSPNRYKYIGLKVIGSSNGYEPNNGYGYHIQFYGTCPGVSVMPDGALYWYGNEAEQFSPFACSWSYSGAIPTITRNANNFTITGANVRCGVASTDGKVTVTDKTLIKYDVVSFSNAYIYPYAFQTKADSLGNLGGNSALDAFTQNGINSLALNSGVTETYVGIILREGGSTTLSRIWLE